MEILKDLVRNVIVIIIIGAMLDMMMPTNGMDRYLKLVIGLFIIGAILNPLLKITKNPDLISAVIPNSTGESKDGVATILNNGQKLNKKNNERGIKEFQKRIEQQITALAQLDNGVQILETSVQINSDSANKEYGQIKEVNMLAVQADKNQNKDVSIVAPVEINVNKEKISEAVLKPLSELVKDKLIKTVTNFYGLKASQVHIQNP